MGYTYPQWLKVKAGIHATWFLSTRFVNILTFKYCFYTIVYRNIIGPCPSTNIKTHTACLVLFFLLGGLK